MVTDKTWWAPVWRGLVVDAEGKHYRSMKGALWLFLYLVLHADRRTGRLRRKCKTIARDMGLKEKTLRNWLSVLRDQDYVITESNGRAMEIVIKKWKTLGVFPKERSQNATSGSTRLAILRQSGER